MQNPMGCEPATRCDSDRHQAGINGILPNPLSDGIPSTSGMLLILTPTLHKAPPTHGTCPSIGSDSYGGWDLSVLGWMDGSYAAA